MALLGCPGWSAPTALAKPKATGASTTLGRCCNTWASRSRARADGSRCCECGRAVSHGSVTWVLAREVAEVSHNRAVNHVSSSQRARDPPSSCHPPVDPSWPVLYRRRNSQQHTMKTRRASPAPQQTLGCGPRRVQVSAFQGLSLPDNVPDCPRPSRHPLRAVAASGAKRLVSLAVLASTSVGQQESRWQWRWFIAFPLFSIAGP